MWASLIKRKHSMSNHSHQRKLRRSIGSQPVGSFVGPRQPEVGIAAQVIPSQSPRRTFRSLDDGDLAIWSRVTTGFRLAHSSPASTSASPPPFVRTSRGSPQPHLRTTPSPHYLEQPSKRLLRNHCSVSSCDIQVTPPFSLETAKTINN
jgi:hypothetical protein